MARLALRGTVLITGASSGLGAEFARQLAPEARRLVLVARRKQRLEDLARELRAAHPSLEVSVRPCDLGSRLATERLTESLLADESVDVVINNAGFGDRSFVEASEWAKLERMVAVNVVALGELTHRLLGPMLARGRGGVLNVSSILGITYQPGVATYAGTKHFVSAFTKTLRAELSGTGIVVTEVCPGPVATEFGAVANNRTSIRSPGAMRIGATQCVSEALSGFRRGRAVVYPGRINRWVARLLAVVPGRLLAWFMARAARRVRGELPSPPPDDRP